MASSWVNLQDYLALNGDQGNDMGKRVYDATAAKAERAQSQLTHDTIGYGQAARNGTILGPGGDGTGYDSDQATSASQLSYEGPMSLSTYDPTLEGTVNDASKAVQAASDPNQLGSVVKETYGSQGASGVGGSSLDSFLTGQSQTGQQLAGLGKQYQNLQQNLGLAETTADAETQAGIATSKKNAAAWANVGKGKAADGSTAKWHPDDYSDWNSFIDPNASPDKGWSVQKGGQYAHEAAMYANPADWATRAAGELGYNGENASQLFAGWFTGPAKGEEEKVWTQSNLRSAAREVQNEYGGAAMKYWFDHLTPELWKDFMDTGNAGGQARKMRAWLENAGIHKGGNWDSSVKKEAGNA